MSKLGDKFNLPFGKYRIMNHHIDNMVYIDGFYGESVSSIFNTYNAIVDARYYGVIMPQVVIIRAICGAEFTGSFKELEAIINEITKYFNPEENKAKKKSTEVLRLFGKISKSGIIEPITLDKDTLFGFVKMWFKTVFKKATYKVWAIEYSNKEEYAIVVEDKTKR